MESVRNQAEDRMNHAKEQVQFIAQSLKVETKRMDTGRTADLKTALLSLANLEAEYHVQVGGTRSCWRVLMDLMLYCARQSRAAWEGLMSSLQMTDNEVAESRARAQRHISHRKPGEKSVAQFAGML